MASRICVTVAFGLLFSAHAYAQGHTASRGATSQAAELSEAFPWDEPVEQTFSVESVLRWRRGTAAERDHQTLIRAAGDHSR